VKKTKDTRTQYAADTEAIPLSREGLIIRRPTRVAPDRATRRPRGVSGYSSGRSLPMCSNQAASRDAVLDLPGVIEHVPGDAANEVTRYPVGATARPSRR